MARRNSLAVFLYLLSTFLLWTLISNIKRLIGGDTPRYLPQFILFLVITGGVCIIEMHNTLCVRALWLYGLGLLWLLIASMWQFLISLSLYRKKNHSLAAD